MRGMQGATPMLVLEDEIAQWAPDVRAVARNLAREWAGIEADDIEQQIWEAVLPSWRTLTKDVEQRGLFRAAARRAGRVYCRRERYTHATGTGEFIYSTDEVRALLNCAYFEDRSSWPLPSEDDGVSVSAGGIVCALWDLDRAFNRLPEAQRASLVARYAIRAELTNAEEKAAQRGVDTLTRDLNWATLGRKRQADEAARERRALRRPAEVV